MFVGEQPGDKEDLQGLPLVGPAGEVFNAGLEAAGLARERVFITNAVKHFKFTVSGKRRIHQTPTVAEVEHCRWWLLEEVRLVAPRIIVAMGATALRSLTGDGAGVTRRRGQVETGPLGLPVMPTLHPAAILRHPDEGARERHRSEFFADIARAAALAA
jgi:DNA polymerase